MSYNALQWAMRQKVRPPERYLLMIICSYHSRHTGGCKPTFDQMIAKSGLARNSVFNHVKALEAQGIIKVIRSGGLKTGNQYDLIGFNGRDNDGQLQNNELISVMFNGFWKAYPRKVNKKKAQDIFKRIKPNQALYAQIIEDVNIRALTEWKKCEPQFVPHPTSYLNGRRWEDETPQLPGKDDELLKIL